MERTGSLRPTMPVVHIVLFKVKSQVLSNGWEEFQARAETIRDLAVVKDVCQDMRLGPPVWDTRSHGFNYGLYSVFATMDDLVRYKEDNDHKEYVLCHSHQIHQDEPAPEHRRYARGRTDADLLAYDFEL